MAYKKQTSYRKGRSGYGRGSGAYPRSGYIATRDVIAPYRRTSSPESEYFRRVKERARASEVKGPSGFSDSSPRYIEQLPRNSPEPSVWRGNLQEFAKAVLKDALKEIEEKTGEKEVPQKRYEQLRDAAVGTTESIDSWIKDSEKASAENPDLMHDINEIKTKTETDINEVKEILAKREETIMEDPVEFLKNHEVLGDPDDIKEKFSEWKIAQEKDPSDDIYEQFWKNVGKFDYMTERIESELDRLEGKFSEAESFVKSSGIGDLPEENAAQKETESEPVLQADLPSYDQLQPDINEQKRRYYDSEVGY